ncbi:MAG: N,N-dimethylformamidase beta subunit family domain-containing protein [Pontixanthobacter sp.]
MTTLRPLIGYTQHFEVAAGGSIGAHVSAPSGSFDAALVLLNRDSNKRKHIPSIIDGQHQGAEHPLHAGSYMMVPAGVSPPENPHIRIWIYPTTPQAPHDRGVLCWGENQGIFLTADGHVTLRWSDTILTSATPVSPQRWYCIEATGTGATLSLKVETLNQTSPAPSITGSLPKNQSAGTVSLAGSFRIGAIADAQANTSGFDGKIAKPSIFDGDRPVAIWDFAHEPSSVHIADRGPNSLDGVIVQSPMRGVSGPFWSGNGIGWKDEPENFDAIAFHSDDLTDAGWPEALRLDVPDDLPSDAYGIEITSGEQKDVIPLFVTPAAGHATAPLAFVVPTFSYLAYSNERHWWPNPYVEEIVGRPVHEIVAPIEEWAKTQQLLSAYDYHRDGTGSAHVSLRRPLVNMRAAYHHPMIRGPHQLSADLITIEWLRSIGQPFDIITDHMIHDGGSDVLKPYRAIMTGSHPEYVSSQIFDAFEDYIDTQGRIIHLGGNAFYFVTNALPEEPHVLEIRRGFAGTIPWQSVPGEGRQAATGEMSGLWRWRNRSAHQLFGTGTAAVSFGAGCGYRREQASFDPRFAWIFNGIKENEVNARGEVMGGAAGFEVDAARHDLGTPTDTTVLATADAFDPSPILSTIPMEDILTTGSHGQLHSQMTYRQMDNGGHVFSAPSIAWTSCLMDRGGDNPVATLTRNVIDRFTGPDDPCTA